MVRIIAKLDVKPPYVVKPVHFEGLRKVGTPQDLTEKYYSQGVDEIFYIDIVSSLYQREILYDLIEQTARELYVPFAVGGGVKTIEDCSKLFHSGADKVVINTHALQEKPNLIDEAAHLFGSQSVVVNIEAKSFGQEWICYSDCGRIPSTKRVVDWVVEAQERGAGEVLLQSVDNDGRQRGFSIDLAKQVVDSLSIPVVVTSGASCVEDIVSLVKHANPSGVAVASVLHYNKLDVSDIRTAIRGIER